MGNLQLSAVSISFGDKEILKEINLSLGEKDRIALTGANGSGKTTLMKIAAGLIKPDSGKTLSQKNTVSAYLPQGGLVHGGRPLQDEAELAFSLFHSIIKRKEELGQILGTIKEDDPEVPALLEEYHHLEERLLSGGYYSREERIASVLSGLGFSKKDLDKDSAVFSGGWQMRIALAKILLQYPDIMLLDEPTNYLDLEARQWLAEYLDSFKGGVLLVSHDRYFLDKTMKEVAELFHGSIYRYKGIYSDYEIKRKEELEELLKAYKRQTEDIEKIEDFINRFRYNASKSRLVQSRIKYLEKLERIEVPESLKRIGFSFPPAPHSGKITLTLENISKSYGPLQVFRNLSLAVERGEKLAVMGINGAGKSTLLRIIAGQDTDYSGTVSYGTGVKKGYFSQDILSAFTGETIIQEIEQSAPTHLYPKLRGLLGAFLFRGDDIYKSLSVLSGGEQSRLALLKLLLEPYNLLILDEPTNHLDLTSKDILLEALSQFNGTAVFVSHDRHFIEHLATKILEIEEGLPRLYYGDYSYYQWKKDEETPPPAAGTKEPKTAQESSEGKVKREEEKRKRADYRKLIKESENLLQEIEKLEKIRKDLEQYLASPDIYTKGPAVKEYKEKLRKTEIDERFLYSRWESLETKILQYGENNEDKV